MQFRTINAPVQKFIRTKHSIVSQCHAHRSILALHRLVSRALPAYFVSLLACSLWPTCSVSAQEPGNQFVTESNIQASTSDIDSYVDTYIVGPSDVLAISAPDEPSLTGTFAVEADLTFSYPLIGRVRAGGRSLREVEAEIVDELTGRGFYIDPQIMVTVEQYRNQNVVVVGEMGAPGAYSVSASMGLGEVLVLAGSMLPSADGEAVIVPSGHEGVVVMSSAAVARDSDDPSGPSAAVRRVRLDELADAARASRVTLHGGATNLGATSRIEIVRMVEGKPQKVKADPNTDVLPGDTIVVPQRRF